MNNQYNSFSLLEKIIIKSHKITFHGKKIHPYLLLLDIGVVSCIIFSYLFTKIFCETVFWKFSVMFFIGYIVYEFLFVRLKHLILKIKSRSFLQDCIIFILPFYIFMLWIQGLSIRAYMDLFILNIALVLGFVRIGCFLGGCCYGIPYRKGILYPAEIFVKYTGFRSYTPGVNPGTRVFPIQLVESFVNFSLFGILFLYLYLNHNFHGKVLPVYFLCYSIYRFISDFYRSSFIKRKRGKFTESQIISLCIILICSIILYLI